LIVEAGIKKDKRQAEKDSTYSNIIEDILIKGIRN
jgi:hypothetical protein